MKHIRKPLLGTLVGLVIASILASPAAADPPAGQYRPLAGTGSPLSQGVSQAFAALVLDGDRTVMASYGATGSETIQTTASGARFLRPTSSAMGLFALSTSINSTGAKLYYGWTDITDQLDFARSSTPPSVAGTELTYIPFALDGVTYAYANSPVGRIPSNLPAGSAGDPASALTLRNIYLRNVTTYVSGGVSYQFQPMLPPIGSDTRSLFLQKIGLTEGVVQGLPPHPEDYLAQENDGALVNAPGRIFPFSLASWIAQKNNVAVNTIASNDTNPTNDVLLGSVDGVSPLSGTAINADFPLRHYVWNVVESSRLTETDTESVQLQDAFAGASSGVCAAAATIVQYGFKTIGTMCGNTTTFKSGYIDP